MPKIRTRLESYVVRNTADIVDELSDERRERARRGPPRPRRAQPTRGGGREPSRGAGREARAPQRRARKSRARIEELEHELAKAKAESGDREQRIAEQLETERIRVAEREQKFRSELEAREAEITRRLETLDVREQELRHRIVTSRTGSAPCRARGQRRVPPQELENRSDERLKDREQALDDREAGIARAEKLAATEKQSLERRTVQAAELERRAALRAESFEEREAKLAAEAEILEQRSAKLTELEQQLEHRKDELAAYVARIQGSLPSQPS